MANKKKDYRVYVKDAADWTLEDEQSYDYVLLADAKIFFISREKLDDCEEPEYIPARVAEWLASCEAQLVIAQYAKRIKAAAKKLESDFKDNLDAALEELRQSSEDTDEEG